MDGKEEKKCDAINNPKGLLIGMICNEQYFKQELTLLTVFGCKNPFCTALPTSGT